MRSGIAHGNQSSRLHAGEVAGQQRSVGLRCLFDESGSGLAGEGGVDAVEKFSFELGELRGAMERITEHDESFVST